MSMMQGDAYAIPFTITDSGEELDLSAIHCIEFCVDNIRKNYPEDVIYKSDTGEFLFPITQEETFKLKGKAHCQIRVHYTSGNVIGTDASNIPVRESISKVVL